MRRRFAIALATIVSLSSAAPLRAQSPADIAAARDLFKEGAKAAQEERWAEARDRYERSLALKRAPLTLYSLGVADQHLGKLLEALEHFRAFLAEMDPKSDAYKPYEQPARDAIAELEKRVGKLDIHVEPPDVAGLHVTVDGAEVPKAALGLPRVVDPGEHTIVVRAEGHRESTTTAKVAEGEALRVEVKLEPIAPKKNDPIVVPIVPPKPKKKPIAAYALAAGGGAVFVAGAVVGLVGVQKASDAPTREGKEANQARTLGIVGDVVGGIGLVTAGAGVAMLLLAEPSAPPKSEPAVSVRPVVSPGFVGVVGRF